MDSRDTPQSTEHTPQMDGSEHDPEDNHEFGPGFARTPAKTDEPLTERLLGKYGVRFVHYAVYSLVFLTTFILSEPIFGAIATAVWLGQNMFSLSLATLGSTVSQQFHASLFSLPVLAASTITALSVTSVAYFWNEIRYKRGEWIRTYL